MKHSLTGLPAIPFQPMSLENWQPIPVHEKVRRGVALLRARYLLAHSCEPSKEVMYHMECLVSSGVNLYRVPSDAFFIQ